MVLDYRQVVRTAKKSDLTIPPNMLARAERVIK
jgi:hypothetical protein